MSDRSLLGRCNEFTRVLVSDLIQSFDGDCIECEECRARFLQLILNESSGKKKLWEGYDPSSRTVLKGLAIVMDFTLRGSAEDQTYFNRRIIEVLISCVQSMSWELHREKLRTKRQQQRPPDNEEDIPF